MDYYFKSRRRKFAVAILLLACLFTAGWVRSLRLRDTVWLKLDDETNVLFVSNRSWVYWQCLRGPGDEVTIEFLELRRVYHSCISENLDYFKYFGVDDMGIFLDVPRCGLSLEAWGAPYSLIVVMLMLLFSFLMFSKKARP